MIVTAWWMIYLGIGVAFYILTRIYQDKINMPERITVYAGIGTALFVGSFLPSFGIPLTNIRTGRPANDFSLYIGLTVSAFCFLIFGLSYLRWKIQQDHDEKPLLSGIRKNLKEMPAFLRFMTYFGLLIPLWIIVVAFFGVRIEGHDTAPWLWWHSGAGALTCFVMLALFIASLLCLAKVRLGKWVYFLAIIAYGLHTKISALLLGVDPSYRSLLWSASYWIFLLFYLTKFQSVEHYFESAGSKAYQSKIPSAPQKKRRPASRKANTLPSKYRSHLTKAPKIISTLGYPANAEPLENESEKTWLYCVDNIEAGPVSEAFLRDAIIKGDIRLFDTVKRVDERFWQPVAEVLQQLSLSISKN